MKETTNYNFKLPELTDYIDVSDFNHNFTVIDEELKKANEVDDAVSGLMLQEIYGITYTVTLKMTEGGFSVVANPHDMTDEKWSLADWDSIIQDKEFLNLVCNSQGQEFKYMMDNEDVFKKFVEHPKAVKELVKYPKATEYMVSNYSRMASMYTSSHLGYVRGEEAEGKFLPIGASEDGENCKAYNGVWSSVNVLMGSWLLENLDNPIATKVSAKGENMVYYYNLGGND